MAIVGIFGPVRSPKGHLAFPHLLAPETQGKFPSGKFVTTFLIKNSENFTDLIAACVKATQLEWPTIGITQASQIKLPLRKGTEKPGWEEFIFLKCKSKDKPPIVDARKQPWTGQPKGGDICYLAVSALAYKQQIDAEVAAALRGAGKLVQEGQVTENGVTKRVCWRPAATFLLNGVQFLEAHAPIGAQGTGGADGAAVFEAQAAPAAAAGSAAAADLFG